MNKFVMAAIGGTMVGVLATTQLAAPLLAQESAKNSSVYEQLDLFGDIFERIRPICRRGGYQRTDRSGDQRDVDLA